jgi:hypothetical protein
MSAKPVQVGQRFINNSKAPTTSTAYVEVHVYDGVVRPESREIDRGVVQ